MSYVSLEKYHFTHSEEEYEKEYDNRVHSSQTIQLPVEMNGFPCFVMHGREIMDRIYEVWKLNAQIIKEEQKIPALFPLIQTCLLQEIEMSNELEAIHSSRRELASLIETELPHPTTRRFAGQVRQYQALIEKRIPFPKDSRAVRMIYDLLLRDDIRIVCPESLPDGKYFRKSEVFITDGLKTIHQNGLPEYEIIRLMNETLLILRNENPLISAALFHFIFEWLHPFYDGNGRTGRFLCVLKMAEDLELAGILHFSFTLQTRHKKYYRLFSDAESFWNRGDLTPFVIEFLELLIESMQEGLNMLQEKAALYQSALQKIDALSLSFSHSVFLKTMLETTLFSFEGLSTEEISRRLNVTTQTVRNMTSRYSDLLCVDREGRTKRYSLHQNFLTSLV